jgi:hypothetical protein
LYVHTRSDKKPDLCPDESENGHAGPDDYFDVKSDGRAYIGTDYSSDETKA